MSVVPRTFMKAQGQSEPAETRHYIARMCLELRDLARRSDLPMLAYLLDMARLEAETNEGDRGSR